MTERTRWRSIVAVGATAILVAVTWVYVFAWTVPRAMSPGIADYWFFTGIAERVRAGERLYVDVWDNKDPLVFHSLALARTFGPAGAWLLELLWVVVAAGSLFAMARWSRLGRLASTLIAFVAGPLIILGPFYFMGTTHLPGIALSLLAAALMLRRKLALAGVTLALLALFKLIMLPLALAMMIAIALTEGRRRDLLRSGVAFTITFALSALVLLWRGEFIGFLTTQVDNLLYSQSPIVSATQTSPLQKLASHVVILINPRVLVVEVVLLLLLAWAWTRVRRDPTLTTLWWLAAVPFVVSGLTLITTGKWFAHAVIMAVPAVLGLLLTAAILARRPGRSWWRVPVLGVLTVLLAGVPALSTYRYVLESARTEWDGANRTDVITSTLMELPPARFALVGLSVPRSAGLEDWTLACRYYGQRPFHPQAIFDETLACLPTADVVVLSYDPAEQDSPAFPAYDQFLRDVEDLMSSEYTCVPVDNFRLCQRN